MQDTISIKGLEKAVELIVASEDKSDEALEATAFLVSLWSEKVENLCIQGYVRQQEAKGRYNSRISLVKEGKILYKEGKLK